eukprot:Blabericola_migrator_1__2210@NODE_160_length_12527_cov_93_130417_g140_i0_p1_GENE_NODE_160_length_12527_cov_93_130417_g140_i0NODE_160_length_12527_cov_93_130417_g140_i0_p1_ORF_typecomplete_len930_score225_94eIF3c_N/PF05470_12/2_9e127PCI/PF01399_27/3_1e08_NODE_160_length_12527_cov_93_130417_g140_i0804910838
MGKFWGDDDSSDGGSISEAGSDVEEQQKTQQTAQRPTHKSWASMDGMSSEDEESKRVIKSEKDKRWSALRERCSKMAQHMRANDYVELHEDYDIMLKLIAKARSTIEAEGPPPFLIRALTNLEVYTTDKQSDKEAMKKCSKLKAQAINKLSRRMPTGLKEFREDMDKCLANPKAYESEVSDDDDDDDASSDGGPIVSSNEASSYDSDSDGSSDSDSSSDSDDSSSSSSTSSSASVKSPKSSKSASDDESSHSDAESDSSSTSEESIASEAGDFETKHARAMIKWGYKTKTVETFEQKAAKKEALAKKREESEKKKAAAKAAKEASVSAEQRRTSLLLAGGADLNEKQILQKAQETVAVRGKRGQERIDQLSLLRKLRDFSQAKNLVHTTFEITVYLVTLGLDLGGTGGLQAAIPHWSEVYHDLSDVLDLLLANPDSKFQLSSTSEALADSEQAREGDKEEEPHRAPRDTHGGIRSVLLSFIERLDDNLLKALQAADPHTKEYQDRLMQTVDMLALLWKAWAYYTNNQQTERINVEGYRTAMKLIDQLYYLPDRLATSKWKLVERRLADSAVVSILPPPSDSPSKIVQDLHAYIVSTCPPTEYRITLRSHLSAIYNLAIGDQFWKAHQMFTGSSLNELALSSDVSEQVLYNRTLTQLGLAAFRLGNVQISLQALSDICGSNKQRELLAQGVSVVKGYEKSAEQEKAERRRLLPAHMHINLDVVETVYNICAMLVEIPTMCGNQPVHDYRNRPSRFRRALEQFEKSSTPPESSRESVIAGAKCLLRGDWEQCKNFIMKLPLWDSISNVEKRTAVQDLILNHVKAVALKAYILNYSSTYDSMSVEHMCEMFALGKDDVYSIVSKMIIAQELSAFWDAESEVVLINRTKPSKLQSSALTLVDQISTLLDQSETIQSIKMGTESRRRRPQTQQV